MATTASAAGVSRGKTAKPIPREHGAWGLMLQPFLAAAVLAGRWDWLLIPALALTLAGFLIREPLTVLARRKWAGHRTPEHSPVAMNWLLLEIVASAIAFAILASHIPILPLVLLTVAGLGLTVISVWFALQNKQRSIGLQAVAVAGLGSSALLASLVVTRRIPSWAWIAWGLLSLHGIVSVLCVHARLNMRIAAAHPAGSADPRRPAWVASGIHAIAAVLVICVGQPLLAIPVLFSCAFHWFDLAHLSNASYLRLRLQTVGFRMLAISLTHTLLTIAALWP